MKSEGHPEYVASTMTCACGATYQTRSTKAQLRLGICASCHPFFTGTQKFVDTAGRVEKFRRRFTDNPAAAPKAKAKKRA
ncbi:MAG: 50S ribosomal protein L31 [Verrucomicrobia bacterium]|nr:50S ribosomal protein L31 [Verrucomicrobiota bacterium]